MASRSIDPVPPRSSPARAVLAFVLAPIFAVVAVMYLWIGLDEPTLLAGGVTVGLLSVLWLLAAVRPSRTCTSRPWRWQEAGASSAAVEAFASISATNGLSVTYLIGVVINIAIGYFFVRLTVRPSAPPEPARGKPRRQSEPSTPPK